MTRSNLRRSTLGRQAAVCDALVILAGCSGGPSTPVAASAVGPVTQGASRIWFYRDYEPSISLNMAEVTLNGATAGYAQFDGSAFYRDVAPGRYRIAVASPGLDIGQARDVDLGPGQEAYVKILVSGTWEGGGDTTQFKRDTFYISLIPPQVARSEIDQRPLSGG